jgi:hypothetical protein
VQLEAVSSLSVQSATEQPVLVGGQKVLTIAPTGAYRFFRLIINPQVEIQDSMKCRSTIGDFLARFASYAAFAIHDRLRQLVQRAQADHRCERHRRLLATPSQAN